LKRHLGPFFKDHRLTEITPREIDRYKQAQLRRAEKGARLSNTMINMTLGRLAQILDDAVDYRLIESNPARGKRRRLKTQAVPRTHLDRVELARRERPQGSAARRRGGDRAVPTQLNPVA
jgi:hypothetical protein